MNATYKKLQQQTQKKKLITHTNKKNDWNTKQNATKNEIHINTFEIT